MSPPAKPTLSILEWLGVGGAVLKTFSLAIAALITIPFTRSKAPPTFGRHLKFAIVKALTGSFSPRALVAVSPTTDEAYEKFVASKKIKPESITLADGTRAHWLGDRSTEKVLLFFHGGGYIMPATDGHFHLLYETIRAVEEKGGKLAALVLSYDVSIHAPYPRQLQQAAALLRYALTDLKKNPENILIVGDSAGGNLALALVSHILHPHPKVDAIQIPGQFAGVSLLSPWVTFDTTSQSMHTNRERDILGIPVVNAWARLFKGDAPSDPYLEPLLAPVDWWKGFSATKVQVLAGKEEIFVDDIESFTKRLSATVEGLTPTTVPGEAHDHLVMEFLYNDPRTRQRDAFEEFVMEIVGV